MELKYIRLQNGDTLPSLDQFRPYKAVVIIEDIVGRDWQMKVSGWLVKTGCLNMLAWGRECSSWDDSVDHANLEAFDYEDIPDEHFVMTTWHENQTLDEVIEFAKFSNKYDDPKLEKLLFLHIGSQDRHNEFMTFKARFER